MNQFGAFLSNLRSNTGLSLAELAPLVDTSKSALSRLENDEITQPFKGAIRKQIIELLLTGLDGSKLSIRQKYGNTALTYSSTDRGTAIIPTPVSLQCVIVTKDQQIVLMQRSSSVAYYPNHWSASFEETMNAPGIDRRGKPSRSDDADFFTGAIRGVEEEFALPKEAIESVKILSLNVEYLTLSVDVIIFIKIRLSSEEIRQCWIIEAQDRDEASRFASISTDLHEVVNKLFSKTLWHPTSRMRLIQFLFHIYGVKEVAKAIENRQRM